MNMEQVRKELVRIDGIKQPLLSEGLIRISEFTDFCADCGGYQLSFDLDHAIYKDYVNNNLIHIWTSDNNYNTATALMEDIINKRAGDYIFDIQDILTNEKGVAIWIDALEGLSLEMDSNDEVMEDLGIDIKVMSDIEILCRLLSRKEEFGDNDEN